MAGKLHFRQLLVLVLASVYDVSQKQMGARSEIPWKSVSKFLSPRQKDIPQELMKELLAAIPCTEAEVLDLTAYLEAREVLKQAGDLTEADLKVIAEGVLLASRAIRDGLIQALRRARSKPEPGYPQPADLAAHRFRAGEQLERLKAIPAEARVGVARWAPEFQNWALCERLCEESERQAARNVQDSLAWAQLSQEIASLVNGPEGWINHLQGYVLGHVANARRVAGDLRASEALLEEAHHLWAGWMDLGGVLDPGRLLDLKASLSRDLRRFEEALTLLDEAVKVSRNPARVLIKKGFTLEVMGKYEEAVECLQQAIPLVECQHDRRLRNILRLNLANNFCHLGRFEEALSLVRVVRPQVTEVGDRLDLVRIIWLEGRIAAGLARPLEALRLLSEARRQFSAEGMFSDAALAILEEAVLLLEAGQLAEVRSLAKDLAHVLESQGIHREALAALRLFQEAAESETATVALTRDILSYLFRARHDEGLRFTKERSRRS